MGWQLVYGNSLKSSTELPLILSSSVIVVETEKRTNRPTAYLVRFPLIEGFGFLRAETRTLWGGKQIFYLPAGRYRLSVNLPKYLKEVEFKLWIEVLDE